MFIVFNAMFYAIKFFNNFKPRAQVFIQSQEKFTFFNEIRCYEWPKSDCVSVKTVTITLWTKSHKKSAVEWISKCQVEKFNEYSFIYPIQKHFLTKINYVCLGLTLCQISYWTRNDHKNTEHNTFSSFTLFRFMFYGFAKNALKWNFKICKRKEN